MRIRCAVAILLLKCSAAPAQPVARTLTPADTVAPREIGEVAIAPDSSAIAFIVSQAGGIDISALEKAFVKVGKSYAGRKSISYAAFREFGVPADILKRAGITRANS